MIDLQSFLERFEAALDAEFGHRVWFLGLQGSYARATATEESDLDLVVILDELSHTDIGAYGKLLDTLPHRERLCGFLAGKDELMRWEPADLFQFYYDTRPLKGSLDVLLPRIDRAAVARAVHTGVCNLYHGCVHNMLYEKSEEALRGLYKAASFTIQAMAFLQTGHYAHGRAALEEAVTFDERMILQAHWYLKDGGSVDFDDFSALLFAWAKAQLAQQTEGSAPKGEMLV